MAMMNNPSGDFQGIPGPPQGGMAPAGGPPAMPGMPGAPGAVPYFPRSLTLKEYVQMARAKQMVPRFTNVANQGGDMSSAWMGPGGEGRGNAFLQPGEYTTGPGGEPQRQGIPGRGEAAPKKPQKQIGQMSPEELRNVDVYKMAMDKTKGQLPALFKHVFRDGAKTPKDLSPAQLKHWQKAVQDLNNHNLKSLDKMIERNVKIMGNKNIMGDQEAKASTDDRKEAENDYRAWESQKSKDPMNTQTFEEYRAKKRSAIDAVAPKPKKKQPPPVMSGEETGIPDVGPEPIPGWGPGSVPSKSAKPEPSQEEVYKAAERAYGRAGGDKKKFAAFLQEELSVAQGAAPTSAPAAGRSAIPPPTAEPWGNEEPPAEQYME